ncbi:ribosome maturation factor RimP [Pacificimonas flava]|uniref:ribosome maturation factor RimP n=1 Tax=Pacificimonas flava TaxID=1234595 RepID=UPI00325FC8F9
METRHALADIEALTAMIEPVVTRQGFELVRVQMINTEAGPTLQVMAEDEAGLLHIDQCAALSREISELLDETDPIEGEYNLEVSSPGIDRPLTRAKDFSLWSGHKVRIQLVEAVEGRKKMQGTLLGIDGDAVKVRLEDGSGQEFLIPRSEIHSAKLVLTDDLIAATQPQQMN